MTIIATCIVFVNSNIFTYFIYYFCALFTHLVVWQILIAYFFIFLYN